MPTRCAYCPNMIQDDESYVDVNAMSDGAPTRAHLRCAPKDLPFRETTRLDDRPETETPKAPAGKELRG